MKGYIDFFAPFLGFDVATKPHGDMKYLDWNKVREVIDTHPDSVIYAGLREDWNNTSGIIYAHGKYYNGSVWGCSIWATPIVDVDGEEIECWTYEKTAEGDILKPDWFIDKNPLSEWDFYDN